jgi:hypothetical protein
LSLSDNSSVKQGASNDQRDEQDRYKQNPRYTRRPPARQGCDHLLTREPLIGRSNQTPLGDLAQAAAQTIKIGRTA